MFHFTFRHFDARGVHLSFILIFFVMIFPEHPTNRLLLLIVYVAFLFGYIWMASSPKTWWNEKKYIGAVCIFAGIAGILHFSYGYPDHRILWPLLYLLGIAEPKRKRTTVAVAMITVLVIFFMMLKEISYGALLAAVLMYFAVRNQTLIREAHRTNQMQLEQLNAAYSELQRNAVQSMGYAAMTERMRLARDIHDGLGHQMTSLIVQLQALQIMISKDQAAAANAVDDLLQVARKGMEEIRLAVKEWSEEDKPLGPTAIKGLIAQFEANSRMRIEYDEIGTVTDWTLERSVIIYRVLQEALTNIMKHAAASRVTVLLEEQNGRVKLRITDDGHFGSKNLLDLGFGLTGMIERCESVGGSIAFTPNTPHGLTIEAVIPLETDDPFK